jgi:phosphoglycolate phosphatase-like HAD superfamily hydrolase
MIPNAFAFFDIGDTLASVRLSPAGDSIEEMTVLPDVFPALDELRAEGVRLGILSNRGTIEEKNVNDALKQAGLLQFFDQKLILYGPKNSTQLFERAEDTVRLLNEDNHDEPPILLFVGENAAERSFAQAANFLVADHPSSALPVLRQHSDEGALF